ncbi:M20 family metallopeptidase [Streptomyces nogalater]|uniref:M20 family metallopeptidase n=1 Tax=Streptomyces nogalater TaxID=38314 RepID=A0ABW0WFU6_STRNO
MTESDRTPLPGKAAATATTTGGRRPGPVPKAEPDPAAARRGSKAAQHRLVRLRRALHQVPETGLHLPRTQALVLEALSGLGLAVTTGRRLSSVTAVLEGAHPGPTVLLRADMDALPIAEPGGAPAAATGAHMHACGHDLHTAMLVGAAHELHRRRDRVHGSVVLMFQPGEEEGAGARLMIEEGVLDTTGEQPVAAYALHVAAASLSSGVIATRPGTLMASSDTIRATVRGRGGHGSVPHGAQDPVPVACETVLALQSMVTRQFDIFDPVVVTVGSIHAGRTGNVIPETVTFEATARSFTPAARRRLREAAVRTIRSVAEAHGLGAEVEWAEGYPATRNDPAETAFAASVARGLLGADRFAELPRPVSSSEDFSYVAERVPSAYLLLGACPPDRDPVTAPYNHSPQAAFDESVLSDGAALLAELAVRRLAEARAPAVAAADADGHRGVPVTG